jgi:hypothetical protein
VTDFLLPVPPLARITERLPAIFPEGLNQRTYFTRQIAAKTIFVMFYVGAVEGSERWLRPNQVTRMTDQQSRKTSDGDRESWTKASVSRSTEIAGRWFADNTREPIRDETIKNALVRVGAVVERGGLETTSSRPRYALARDFAELFVASEDEFAGLVVAWQQRHLTAPARARMELVRRRVAAAASQDSVLVTFPNGETRHMSAGISSEITRSVIEEFAPRYLEDPGVLWVSESRNKVVARDDELARSLGLDIEAQRVLPDVILVDVGAEDPLIVFVEVVASDGPVSEKRKEDLLALITGAGLGETNVAFVTAYMDRGASAYRKTSAEIAWGSFVWFTSEPDRIVIFHAREDGLVPLRRLLALG